MDQKKNILVVGGTDASGGAGLRADIRVVHHYNAWPVTLTTAVVAQNTQRVVGWDSVSPELFEKQIEAIKEDFECDAIKIGMIGSDAIAMLLENFCKTLSAPIVIDPVLHDGTGSSSLSSVSNYDGLFSMATLITPNSKELNAADFRDYPILKKAGHDEVRDEETITDVLCVDGESQSLAPLPRYGFDPRGTGCHLSTAIACELASGKPLLDAVESARIFVNHKFASADSVGKGRKVLS